VSEGSVASYEAALRAKYVQYREAEFVEIVVFDVVSLIGWAAAAEARDTPPVG
jgi:hypothetical protein